MLHLLINYGDCMERSTKFKAAIKILDSRVNDWGLPSYAKEGDAGIDLRACIDDPIVIKEGECVLIPTGIAVYINDPNVVGLLMPRSGLGHKQGIVLGNTVGVIDSQYQGQILASIWNRNQDNTSNVLKEVHSDNRRIINPGDLICQLIFMPFLTVEFDIVDSFVKSDRGEGGFGHTGLN